MELFYKARAGREAGATVSALRRHFEDIREAVVADNPVDVDVATRLLVNRLLHTPSETLREVAESDSAELPEFETAIIRLFGLEGASEDEDAGGKT